ncbi:MAG TPA: WG repeat-containing protein [Bacteroidia bacterium]|jgi:hypothetical protein
MRKELSFIFFLLMLSQAYAQKTYPSNTWAQIPIDCKIGYVSPAGKLMIPGQFEHASGFSEGLAFVWTYANHRDAEKTTSLGEEYKYYDIVSNSITGIIDSTGTYIVQPKLNFQMVRPFQDGIAYVRIDNEVRIINKKGELIPFTDPRYDKQYKQILRVAKNKETGKPSFANAYSTSVYQGFDGCEEFSGNFAAIKMAGKAGYINRAGELTIVPQFQEGGPFKEGYATVATSYPDNENRERKFYGLIDTLGNYVISPKYSFLGEVSEGLISFTTSDRKMGYLNIAGDTVVAPLYTRAYSFSEGLAHVEINGKSGYINKKGAMVIAAAYEWCRPFKAGVALVTTDKHIALINTSGNIIYGPVKMEDCDKRNCK